MDPNDQQEDKQKEALVLDACRRQDLDCLRGLSESARGFLTDATRQKAWPLLLGLGPDPDEQPNGDGWRDLPRHRDEDQVQLDVDRAFVYYPAYQSEAQIGQQKRELSDLIVQVLRRHPYLHYFQGYHDICQVILLVLAPAMRAPAVERLSLLRIRDFMLPTLAPAMAHLDLMPDILRLADPTLCHHLQHADTGPYYGLSGMLTMFAHEVPSLSAIARLFDALLAHDPSFAVYLFAAAVRARRADLLAIPPVDADLLHHNLSTLLVDARGERDMDLLVQQAVVLATRFPLERLPSLRQVLPSSVLRTARDLRSLQTQSLAQANIFFDRHVKELERRQSNKSRAAAWSWARHPALVRYVGISIVLGVLAIWLRKGGGTTHAAAFLAPWL